MNYRMPAEWEPHAATWLAWPHQPTDWPGKFEPIAWVYADIIRHLSRSEPVRLIVPGDGGIARKCLERAHVDLAEVEFWTLPTDRSWIRDYGPIYVRDEHQQRMMLDFHFNAWAKYDNWQADDAIPAAIATRQNTKAIQPMWQNRRIVLEGGSIDVNGQGLLLTTEECLLSSEQERNPGMTRSDYEAMFTQYLGIEQVIWLNCGIVGDDTHGHVDDIARFVHPMTVVTVLESNPQDANFDLLHENLERLKAVRIGGKRLEIIALPMPRPIVFEGQALPASYANFYIGNHVVLMPTFNDPNDRIALNILTDMFPERQVIGIHAVDLVWGLGTLHCLSQQEPQA